MKSKLKKVSDSDGSVYFVDSKRNIQGELKNYDNGILVSTENYKNDIKHGKTEVFLSGGGSETEYFFYGKSVGEGEEGKIKFELLNSSDLIQQRLGKKL